MKIHDTKPTNSTSSAKKTKKPSAARDTGFADLLSQAGPADENTTTVATGDAAPISPVNNSLLSLQEIPDGEYRDRKAVAQGRITLNKLEDIRNQLLAGRLSSNTLHSLEQVIASQRKSTTFNPQLKEILDEIELRAAVELAKLEKAQNHT